MQTNNNKPLPPEGMLKFSVAAHYMKMVFDYVARCGLPLADFVHQARLDANCLSDPNGRVPFPDFVRACDTAGALLDEPFIGLRLGQSVKPGHLGSHGYAMMSCTSARELLEQTTRYSALTVDAGHNEFIINGDHCIRYWHSNLPDNQPLGRTQDELYQSSFVGLARAFGDREELSPTWVSFRHPRPNDISEYEAFFRCELRFNAPFTALCFPSTYLDFPLPHANPHLRTVMDDLSTQLLKQHGNALEPGWLAIARRKILDSFKQGVPDIDGVAQASGMTGEQFREKLAEHGTSFRAFIDELRQGLALGYIRDPGLTLVDVAWLLGFSEQSAFQRAFKRWTGMTPGQYRRQHG